MMLIYLPVFSSRSEYIFDWIFKQELGLEYKVTTDLVIFNAHGQEKINYSFARHKKELFIRASPFLFEDFIKRAEIMVEEKYQTKVLFPNDASCDMGFDIFSAAFYMVSRYEEYLPFTPDRYGRFKAGDSLSGKNNFLQVPVVDRWIGLFRKLLQDRFPELRLLSSRFKAIVTYDIDVAYKFKGRSFFRTAGSFVKDLLQFNFENIPARLQTLINMRRDPWDVYDQLAKIIDMYQLDTIFFFLLGNGSRYDRNLNYRNLLIKNLVRKVIRFSEIGIHPSFLSNSFPEKFSIEKKRLEDISHKRITKSRQHFLKLILPDTYRQLASAGITEDYSMGFPEMAGFRAGTCKSFYFYDLKNEQSSSLKILPVCCMDFTFVDYLKMTPEEALQNILKLVNEIQQVNGTFISIWHNNIIAETKPRKNWNWVHEQLVMQLGKLIQNQ